MRLPRVFLGLAFLLGIGGWHCTDRHMPFDTVSRLVEDARPIIVDSLYGGGHHIRSEMLSFSYNNYTQSWRIQLRIVWLNGASNQGLLWCEGLLVTGLEGGSLFWTAKKMSHNLRRRLNDLKLQKGSPGRRANIMHHYRSILPSKKNKSDL